MLGLLTSLSTAFLLAAVSVAMINPEFPPYFTYPTSGMTWGPGDYVNIEWHNVLSGSVNLILQGAEGTSSAQTVRSITITEGAAAADSCWGGCGRFAWTVNIGDNPAGTYQVVMYLPDDNIRFLSDKFAITK
ncbi:uncharacterized protein UTRI_03816_B [Ustilago trichophora]|uniref:Uncharacterized protein n=1 Tax=Ustilago trichophora TaxID=86804 RepID=A0A5C3DYY8_9BASI|nr:uncharacterized protein UTRI_03816_B [Ustilago trichophora]